MIAPIWDRAERPSRLWSLWDIMDILEPGWLMRLSHGIALAEKYPDGPARPEVLKAALLPALQELLKETIRLHLPVSSNQIHEGISMLCLTPPVVPNTRSMISNIEVEMRTRAFFALSSDRARLFEPKEPLFGLAFATKFSSGAYDLDEMSKCMALERSTAAVFHAMRLIEIGLRATAKCLGAADPLKGYQRSWHIILTQRMKPAIDQKWPQSTRLGGDGIVFNNIYASLDAIKNAWRDPTMHVGRVYTLEEATHIFYAVKGCMTQIAERMDEKGKPKA